MARTSKLLSKEIVSFAEESLKNTGKTGAVAIKLRAIIAAEKHGITHVAKIFDTTKASIIAWIKHLNSGSLDLLSVQAGRGRKHPITEAQEKIIRQWIEEDSQLTIDRVKQRIMSKFRLDISRSSVHRIMKKLRLSYITARPKHYKQNSEALPEAKKNLIQKISERPLNRIFFMDEARFGTHSKQGHGWFETGKRSRVKVKLGFKNFYAYSSIEPATGEAFSLILPKVNSEMMNIYLQELSERYHDEEITLIMDGAGWHKSQALVMPKNIYIVCLPPYSPELNPVERFWLFIKSNTIRNKIYDSLDDLENAVCNFLNSILPSAVAHICIADWFI